MRTLEAQASTRPLCSICEKPMTFALPFAGKGLRSWQCIDCERPDPLKSDRASGWLNGELGQEQ